MKPAVNIARILVGLLFIFSGLVKANDPLGLSYKMQEFFELWGIPQFNSWTLLMSVLMNAFEIIAGFALLLGWRIKLFSWLLLLLIVFFTFLTGYAYFSGKFRNCGCFGDCLPITPRTSFIKDLILLVLIGFLFWKQALIKPLFNHKATTISMLAVTIFSFGLQWYTLTYLPLADCLPFKEGNNIPEKMKTPPGALPDSFAIRFVYEKGGKQFEFSPAELPADLATYKFISRKDKLVRKGNAEPPIKGFALTQFIPDSVVVYSIYQKGNDTVEFAKDNRPVDFNEKTYKLITTENRVVRPKENRDITGEVLSQPHAILLFCEDFSVPFSDWKKKLENILAAAKSKKIPLYVVTAQPAEARKALVQTVFQDILVLTCDNVAIRTAARTNPCLYLLEKGTILGKWSHPQFNNALKKINQIN